MRDLGTATFALVANGNADSPPAAGVRDYLVRAEAGRVTAIFHPLTRDEGGVHTASTWEGGSLVSEVSRRLPSRPPLTYALDPFVPLRRRSVDVWIGFNNLAAAHGIVRRRLGLVGQVVYWAVDFVPDRFGTGARLSAAYDAVDRFVCRHSDLRIELSQAALDGRAARLGLGPRAAPTHIAPIGIWLDRVPHVPEDGWRRRRVVYIGHLVERQGVATLVDALALLPDVELDVVGRGPQEAELRARADSLGVADRITWHGFFPDHRDVERVVAGASVAAAPYSTAGNSFTQYADPSKLRTYAGAGLPIVLTDVPPNAREFEREGGAVVVDDNAPALADAIRTALESPAEWQRRRADALSYASGFDWATIVGGALQRLDR